MNHHAILMLSRAMVTAMDAGVTEDDVQAMLTALRDAKSKTDETDARQAAQLVGTQLRELYPRAETR